MFRSKPSFAHPRLGSFRYADGEWSSGSTRSSAGEILIAVEGDRHSPNPRALEQAEQLVASGPRLLDAAATFAQRDPQAREFMTGGGELLFDGFTVSSIPGRYCVNLALADWPDAMITVQFENGQPTSVSPAD